MKIRRFVAKDMRTALAQIKEELGVDAVIMSNKKIPEGVELMAAVDYSQAVPPAQLDKNSQPPGTEPAENTMREISNDVVNLGQQKPLHNDLNLSASSEPLTEPTQAPADSLSALLSRQVQQPATAQTEQQSNSLNEASIEQQLKNFTDRLSHTTPDNIPPNHQQTSHQDFDDNITADAAVNIQTASPLAEDVNSSSQVSTSDFVKMQQEMASIRSLLEHQVSGLMWQDMAQKDPQRAVLVNRLLALGLNEQIADQIAGYVPEQSHEKQAWQQATQLIAQQINTTQNDIIHRGGVVALVGPTGVGKTTTIAKLAAGFAQVHGSDQVALISTDTFRIAGFEQLATYGKIIGCQVSLAKDSQSLDVLLQQFSKKKLI